MWCRRKCRNGRPTRATTRRRLPDGGRDGARAPPRRARDRECETRSVRDAALAVTPDVPRRGQRSHPGSGTRPFRATGRVSCDARTRHDGRARRVRSPLVTQKLRVNFLDVPHHQFVSKFLHLEKNPPTASFVVDVTRRLRGCSGAHTRGARHRLVRRARSPRASVKNVDVRDRSRVDARGGFGRRRRRGRRPERNGEICRRRLSC